jgi:hypothetical protein
MPEQLAQAELDRLGVPRQLRIQFDQPAELARQGVERAVEARGVVEQQPANQVGEAVERAEHQPQPADHQQRCTRPDRDRGDGGGGKATLFGWPVRCDPFETDEHRLEGDRIGQQGD